MCEVGAVSLLDTQLLMQTHSDAHAQDLAGYASLPVELMLFIWILTLFWAVWSL